MRWFESDEMVLRYHVRYGKGPYLVLIHEMGGSIESWDWVMEHLPADQGVVLPEMRGMGQSQKLSATPSFAAVAADVQGSAEVAAGREGARERACHATSITRRVHKSGSSRLRITVATTDAARSAS